MTTLNPLNADAVLLKEADQLIDKAMSSATASFHRPMLLRSADERLQVVMHRTGNPELVRATQTARKLIARMIRTCG